MAFFPQDDNTQDISGIPANDELAKLELQRKLKMAQALQEAKNPEGQMVSGHYVAPSWTQYAANALNKYYGGKREEEAIKNYGEYTKTKQAQLGDVLKSLKPYTEDVPLDTVQTGGAPGMWETKTIKPDINTTISLMNKYDPNFGAKIAETSISKALMPKEPLKGSAGDVFLDPNTYQPLYSVPNKPEIGSLQKDFEYAKSQGFKGGVEDWKKVIQQPPAAFYQALPTAQGYAQFNARTGQIAPLPLQGQSVLPAAQSPALQGEIAGARMGSEAQAKRAFNMTGAGNVIAQAESILTGKTKPTASGIGALADVAGSVVGYAPRGAAQADQLKAIGGQLVAKMPRMEGPQSDRDVQLYTQMAGQIGDATIPISRRLAALQTVKSIVQKYEPMNQPTQPDQPTAQPNQPKTIRFEDLK